MATVSKRRWSDSSNQRKVGGHRAGESWQIDYVDDEGKRRKKSGFRTKADAEAYLLQKQTAIRDGLSRSMGDKVTLRSLQEEFFLFSRKRVERGIIGEVHLQNMESHFRNYICRSADWKAPRVGKASKPFHNPIGHLKVGAIRHSTVNKFRDDLFSAGLSYTNVRAILNTLSQALKYAKDRDYVALNVAQGVKIEVAENEKNIRVTPPSPLLMRAVIDAAPSDFRLLIQFSASTGVRAGELRALRYRHIDFEKGSVQVRAAIKRDGRAAGPKSKAGIRNIPLSPLLVRLLKAHRTRAEDGSEKSLVFPGADGKVLGRQVLLNNLNKITKGLGFDGAPDGAENEEEDEDDMDGGLAAGRFTWHALRHFAISSWIAAGLGLKAVQVFAGHADVTTTWNRYGHLFPDDDHWIKIAEATGVVLDP